MNDFLSTLPAAYVGSGALITDEDGRVLLVKPTYKPGWEIPGGAMDAGEYPRETLRRELAEELGLAIEPGRLLVVDFMPARPERPRPSIMYVFDCGRLTAAQHAALVLQTEELSEYHYVGLAQLDRHLTGRLLRRMRLAHRGLTSGEGPIDLENGYLPGAARAAAPDGVDPRHPLD
ncbi:NUDIX hydrolase [Actinospica durhamensis]|uniref:NUDIX hydrolase n=1 Tax=Actinospica durhamensis TaxID=1508375 RepID=A0A941ELU5_9ACTN|nr:NUDIX hydrolase [Actinospica durhamensis]MBR7832728.1 NUDIX hydrolase [Actinospica durhamensis]